MQILTDYVKRGGRIVTGAPSFWFDDRGKCLRTDTGSEFEQLFGVQLRDFQYANNTRYKLHGEQVEGWVCDLEITSAQVLASFSSGKPAVTEHRLGKGTAVYIGAEASHQCFKPGNDHVEQWLRDYAMGPYEAPYRCDDAVVYRLATPTADHYFIYE